MNKELRRVDFDYERLIRDAGGYRALWEHFQQFDSPIDVMTVKMWAYRRRIPSKHLAEVFCFLMEHKGRKWTDLENYLVELNNGD